MKDQQTCNIVSSRVILFPQDNIDIVGHFYENEWKIILFGYIVSFLNKTS